MPLIRLQPHLFASLPAHPSLTANEARPQLKSFTRDALHEALDFLHTIPETFTTDPKLRASPPSEAKVKLLRRWRDPLTDETVLKSPGAEFWVCRQSEHADANTEGTASWEEFENGLRSNHAENEMAYTPSVTSVQQLMQWSRADIGIIETHEVGFKDVDMEINLITHTFHPGALIAPRSFISLTISAAYDNTQGSTLGKAQTRPLNGFVTVQIPLRSTASSTPPDLHQKIIGSVPKRAIFANYASVEHVTLLPPTGDNDPNLIEWTMATTSDAGGSIPQWVQRNWTMGGVPRAVVADVGLFLGWTMRRRSS
ncbi:hypothetical protein N7456_011847 [Penicillium angulare]|uniref:DUF3074 domain-containing protein n=1 Tax=Penicillium angulare TaxID=116970 RepID=A0A9W9K0K2_9EURO|nr:hypothetical protein N7456_011847 [Penicillium angulare]